MIGGTRQRFLRATPATLSWTAVDSDGEPSEADPGTVTIGVTRADGTTVVAAGTATTGTGAGARTYALTAAQTVDLDVLTATWTIAGTIVAVTPYDIVGGYYFTSAELRTFADALADQTKNPTPQILQRRAEVETMFESSCNLSFVPRFSVVELASSGGCVLSTRAMYLRRVRWIRQYTTSTDYMTVDSAEVAALPPSDWGGIERASGTWGSGRIQVGIEHGLDAPPADAKRAAMLYARYLVTNAKSAIPDRAVAYASPDGGSFQLGRVGTEWRPTGVDSVDEILRRGDYDHRIPGVA